jgi:4-alpha-glucanotransferase
MDKRASGILLHISSLASPFGIGDFGPQAFEFVDFLAESGQSYWQILPLNPTSQVFGNSPYSSNSAFAGNTLFISPQLLLQDGLLSKEELCLQARFSQEYCDYPKVIAYKDKILDCAFKKFKQSPLKKEFEKFCQGNSHWLNDYVTFLVIKKKLNRKDWGKWPKGLKDRHSGSLERISRDYRPDCEKERFLQFLFFRQWAALKDYCRKKDIKIIGDLPIYVNYDSADVWSNRDIFKLGKNCRPSFVAGVPPDYFSKTGQLWGDPVYDWDNLKNSGYSWWIKRFRHISVLFDIIRIDHFRGFVAFWQIKAGEKTAMNGEWVKAPVRDFFKTILKDCPGLGIIAEDLGYITDDVRKVIQEFNFPGMRVLLFAFNEDNPRHPYLPKNYIENCLAYTGTHDNNTVKGWFKHEADKSAKRRLYEYAETKVFLKDVHKKFINLLFYSPADTVIIPMQDILGLGQEARMNYPSTLKGNWEWRVLGEQLSERVKRELLNITKDTQRDN